MYSTFVILNSVGAGKGKTFNIKLVLLAFDPSLTTSVISVTPIEFVVGFIVTNRLELDPPKIILALETNVILVDVPVTTKFVAGVSTSPTVKGIGPTGTFIHV